MTIEDKKAIRNFMETIQPITRECMKNVYQRYQPDTVKEFLDLSTKCLEEKEGSSGSDFSEQKKIIGHFKGEYVEVQELLSLSEEYEEVTYKPKNGPKR